MKEATGFKIYVTKRNIKFELTKNTISCQSTEVIAAKIIFQHYKNVSAYIKNKINLQTVEGK